MGRHINCILWVALSFISFLAGLVLGARVWWIWSFGEGVLTLVIVTFAGTLLFGWVTNWGKEHDYEEYIEETEHA